MSANAEASPSSLVATGVMGLDHIMGGGLVENRMYLLEGKPGSGKTTLSLQFLMEGVRLGEWCMFVRLSESVEQLRATAKSHAWSLDGIHILEIIPSEESLEPDSRYTLFHPSEVELAQTTKTMLAEAKQKRP